VPTKPLVQALWLADDVSKDPATGKVTVKGLFDRVYAKPPANEFNSRAYLFFGITGVHGKVSLRLCYVDLSDNAVLLQRQWELERTDPVALLDVAIRLRKIPIPHSGVYAWELYCDDDQIGSARIRAFAGS
jgi:hypothetical protein